jgi:diguanylate cyclase (GGDEF)-like protein
VTRSRFLLQLASFGGVAAIGVLDYTLGEEIDLDAVYLLPILASAYSFGQIAAVLAALISALAWLINTHLLRTEPVSTQLLVWDALGQLAIYVTVAYFIGLARREQLELGRQATSDHLTGLANRRSLRRALDTEIARAQRYGRSFGVVAMDCDGLKRVNDELGHAAGDGLIVQVAQIIASGLRPIDVAARLGGDEFLVLLPESDSAGAKAAADRIVSEVRTRFAVPDAPAGSPRTTTMSAGVAVFPDDAATADALLATADRALYRAKEHGRDRVELASEET